LRIVEGYVFYPSTGLEQGKQSGAVHGFRSDISLEQQPRFLGVPATAALPWTDIDEEAE
jgi:hypothetical protein